MPYDRAITGEYQQRRINFNIRTLQGEAMIKHVWRFGDWAEIRGERNRFVCNADGRYGADAVFVSRDGNLHTYRLVEATHLPDCDSWDWQPKLQLREGAWYERRDGKVVGPCEPRTDGIESVFKWYVGGATYEDDGKWCEGRVGIDLIREVPAPLPPVKKYRPFANAQEFKPHQKRLIYFCGDRSNCLQVYSFNDNGIWHAGKQTPWHAMFSQANFDDDETPFGVEVTE